MRLALNYQHIDPSRGGAETYLADLCQRLIQAGHRVDVFAESWAPGALPPEVGTIRIAAPGRSRRARILNFGRYSEASLRLSADDYDCTIGFINTWFQDVIIPQGGVRRASLEYNAQRFPPGWRRDLYRLGKQINPKAWTYAEIERRQYDPSRPTRVVAVSEMVRDHLKRYNGVPGERIRVIPNAIDADRLEVPDPEAARRAFRAGLGLGQDDLVGLFVAHNFRLKGLHRLLEALHLRQQEQSGARPIHLVVCGGGKLRPFRRIVARLGLQRTVHLAGFQADIRPSFWGSDFFVLPTYYDPCSLVVFEALACGLPVITTACNGAGELIGQGREGFVILSPDEIEAMAHALDRMADDPARRAMSERAARLGRAQSMDNHVSRLIDLFEDVAASRNEVPAPHIANSELHPLTPKSYPLWDSSSFN
ncbi:glycosyltransferase family 4 protein [soil metagenome]